MPFVFSHLIRFGSFFLKGVPIEDFWRYLTMSLVAGGTSGAVSLVVLYPLDFARTRVGTDVRTSKNRQFRGSIDCLRKTYASEVRERVHRYSPMFLKPSGDDLGWVFRVLKFHDFSAPMGWIASTQGQIPRSASSIPSFPPSNRICRRSQGLVGIYRGFDIAVAGVIAWRALYFGFYDTLTTRMLGGRHGGSLVERWAVAQAVTTVAGT